jgi:hypothetical protein
MDRKGNNNMDRKGWRKLAIRKKMVNNAMTLI